MAGPYGNGGADHGGCADSAGGRELCATCGTPAYSGEMFCISCGTYLGWDDTGARAVVHEAPRSAAIEPPPGCTVDPGQGAGAAGAAIPMPRQPPPTAPASSEYPWPASHPSPGTESYSMDPADHSGFGPVSPACDQPRAASPGAVHCPECGDGNDVRRSYCCSCGAEVRPAPESPQLTKWQLLRKRWDERPRPWHMDRRWLLLPVVLPCCFAAGVTAAWSGGAVRAVSPAIKDRFSAQVAMAPKKVEATSEAKGYQVSKAVDGVDNRGWAPDRQGADAIGQSLKAEFSRPFRLTGLAIVGGAGRQPKQYLAVGRPTRFTATAVTAGGTVVRKELRLADQPGPQDFRWGVDNVVSLTLQISDVHAGLQPRAPIGVAEVQFFTRRDT